MTYDCMKKFNFILPHMIIGSHHIYISLEMSFKISSTLTQEMTMHLRKHSCFQTETLSEVTVSQKQQRVSQ